MGQPGDQGRSLKILGDKWKWSHDAPKSGDIAQAVLRREFTAVQAYLKKQETSQVHNPVLTINELAIEEQTKPKVSKRK